MCQTSQNKEPKLYLASLPSRTDQTLTKVTTSYRYKVDADSQSVASVLGRISPQGTRSYHKRYIGRVIRTATKASLQVQPVLNRSYGFQPSDSLVDSSQWPRCHLPTYVTLPRLLPPSIRKYLKNPNLCDATKQVALPPPLETSLSAPSPMHHIHPMLEHPQLALHGQTLP